MSNYNIQFTNNTDILVQVTTSNAFNGNTNMISKIVKVNETIHLPSFDGEWFVDTFITDISTLVTYMISDEDYGFVIGKINQKNNQNSYILRNNNFDFTHKNDHFIIIKRESFNNILQ